jgi:hypothetical protein
MIPVNLPRLQPNARVAQHMGILPHADVKHHMCLENTQGKFVLITNIIKFMKLVNSRLIAQKSPTNADCR